MGPVPKEGKPQRVAHSPIPEGNPRIARGVSAPTPLIFFSTYYNHPRIVVSNIKQKCLGTYVEIFIHKDES